MKPNTPSVILFAASAVLAGASFLPPASAIGDVIIPPDFPCDSQRSEPVVMKETTGSTLLGPIHRRFTVYNNGIVSVSEMSGDPATSKAAVVSVPESAVRQLATNLAAAQAFGKCDGAFVLVDVPATTLTVFRGGMDAQAHSFTYFEGDSDYAGVEQVLDAFEQTWFASF